MVFSSAPSSSSMETPAEPDHAQTISIQSVIHHRYASAAGSARLHALSSPMRRGRSSMHAFTGQLNHHQTTQQPQQGDGDVGGNTHFNSTTMTTTTTMNATATSSPSIHPQFRSKAVCKLFCRHCAELMCKRGMKAILLGNTKVELYSTDSPPGGVQLVYNDYTTQNCLCRIRDAACLRCGNVVGYHVTQPCAKCLEACNNGHFWMFLSDGVRPEERLECEATNKVLRWATLLCAAEDKDVPSIVAR